MQVGDEMHHELERLEPLPCWRRGIAQHRRKALNGSDDAITAATIPRSVIGGQHPRGRVDRDVDVVPWPHDKTQSPRPAWRGSNRV